MQSSGEGPWSSLSSGKKVALVLGLPVGATVGYILYRHFTSSNGQRESVEQARLTVPPEVYRSIARHSQSSFLDLVSQQSGAQVRLLSENKGDSISFQLEGSARQVLIAKCALDKLASDCEVITEDFEVPQTALGRIIGRGGESLKLINRTSGARISCPKDRDGTLAEAGRVSITGIRREVYHAKELVMEKVAESEEVRQRIAQSSALRHKRCPSELQGQKEAKPKSEKNGVELHLPQEDPLSQKMVLPNGTTEPPDASKPIPEEQSITESGEQDTQMSPQSIFKFEIPSPDLSFQPDEHLEVYVSAAENPQHFWIQILGVRSLQLDKLTAEMGRFYSTGTAELKVEKVVVGDIVAAPYRNHGTWNRARVLNVLESGLVDVYYVDYGDNGELSLESLRSMRSDFLSLPFQAIECSLAGVSPAGGSWTEEALDDFDRLTYCAQWKPLLAKLCSYSHSDMSSWPSVQLYDNSDGKLLGVGEELIRMGHAVHCLDLGDGGLKGTRDNPGSLQKMLDDVTGVTSELSLSCISLSGFMDPCGNVMKKPASCFSFNFIKPLETVRADADQGSCILLMNSLSNWDSTPSQVSPDVFSSSSTTSSPCVEVMTSVLNSLTLSDEVFFSGASSSDDGQDVFSISSGPEFAVLNSSSESNISEGSSSSGIRSVWYYLSSSNDSTVLSLSTSLSTSCHSQTDSESAVSDFLNGHSLDLSESLENSDGEEAELLRLDVIRQKKDARSVAQPSLTAAITCSEYCSCGGASGFHAAEVKEESKHCPSLEEYTSSFPCQKIKTVRSNLPAKDENFVECRFQQVLSSNERTDGVVTASEEQFLGNHDVLELEQTRPLQSVESYWQFQLQSLNTSTEGNTSTYMLVSQEKKYGTGVRPPLHYKEWSIPLYNNPPDSSASALNSEVASISGSMDDVIGEDLV
ncbi:tudor and KH domain-containing protein isoform X2 [Brienomyrus brachyistius]|uniref:tudor and KH domain-containing protein isoform X2 n=1 Tax=Brienomyrus brachyistius TaxID=42636 RepID=UPI0020B2CA50|nr:tudor and KH domain-containing protein isoform X2 [Brienomyrus brachyistius]